MVAHPQVPKADSDYILALQKSHTELARAVSRGQPALRDASGNILTLDPSSGTPLLVAQGHDVAVSLRNGTAYITDESGIDSRPLQASEVTADTVIADTQGTHTGDTYGFHYGDIGISGSQYNGNGTWWGRLNGDSYGFHYGDIGVSGSQFNGNGTWWGRLNGDSYGTHHGAVDPAPKAFVVPHPIDSERWLVHACTESPYNGVEYWGSVTLRRGVARVSLPAYFEELTEEEGRAVHLTPILDTWKSVPQDLSLCATYPRQNQFGIVSNHSDEDFDVSWLVHAVRKDVPALLVEPRRAEVKVSGIGPYRTYSISDDELPDVVERPSELIKALWEVVGREQLRVDELSLHIQSLQDKISQLETARDREMG